MAGQSSLGSPSNFILGCDPPLFYKEVTLSPGPSKIVDEKLSMK